MLELFDLPLPGGLHLSCRAMGPRDAPALVFLHGFPEAAFIWDEQMRGLATRYRCIAPNLRGYERSSRPREVEAYRAKDLVGDIVALIEQSGAPLEALIAHDWGGAVAWNLAVQYPQLLRRLVILNSPHPGTFLRELQLNPAQQQASAYMNALCQPDAEARFSADGFAALMAFFEHGGGSARWLDDALRQRYRELWSGGITGMLNYYRASPMRPPTAQDPAALALRFAPEFVTAHVPTTVIWGEADRALPPALLDGLETFVPRLRVERVAGAGHWLIHEQPTTVAALLEAALLRA